MRAYAVNDDNNTMRIIPRIAWFRCVRGEWKGVFQFETRFLLDFPPFAPPPSPYVYDDGKK